MLFAGEARWTPVPRSYEVWLFERRHPYHQRDGVEVVRFLARRGGDVVGRVCAHHVEGAEDGWFGAFECADDPEAVAALVDEAAEWVAARGATRLSGPATFTLADDAGVLVDGFDHPGGTARPWHPPWYAAHLHAAGLEPLGVTDRVQPGATRAAPSPGDPEVHAVPAAARDAAAGAFPRWRLETATPAPERSDPADRCTTGSAGSMAPGGPVPPHAGKLGDPRLVLTGDAGTIAAVPDITATLRATSLRAARRLPSPTEATIVRLEGDPAALVPALLAAAHAAGYTHVWSPWAPPAESAGTAPPPPPDTLHQVLTRHLA